MGKRKSTRRGAKPNTGPRKAVRRQTAIYKPATGENRRITGPAPGKAGRRSVDMGVGAKYAALVSVAVIAVVAGAVMAVVGSVRSRLEKAVTERCLETARSVSASARAPLEEGSGLQLNLAPLFRTGGGSISELLSIVIQDAAGREILRQESRRQPMGAGLSGRVSTRRGTYTLIHGRMRNEPVVAVKLPVYSQQGRLAGTIIVTRSMSGVGDAVDDLWPPLVLIGAGVLAVAVFLTFMLAGRTGEEMGKVDVQMRRMSKQLRSAREKEKVVERIEHDLDAAREIQAQLLPPKIPQIPGYDVFPFYRSAKEVGGDYYDFFPVDNERLAMVVADVSGKGIPGSMIMATTRTLLRVLGPQCGEAPKILRETNAWVAKDIKRGMFVTAIFSILNVRTKQMSVCSAGHNPMVVFRERTGQCEFVNPNGIALGFDRGPIFDRTLQERTITLEGGDRVVMYTDGVVEAMSPDHEEYGDERFYEFVRMHARMKSKDFVLALVRDLDEHKATAEQHDDITISTFRTIA